MNKYGTKEMTKEEFENMRNDLKLIGLEKLMPEAIYNIIEKKND